MPTFYDLYDAVLKCLIALLMAVLQMLPAAYVLLVTAYLGWRVGAFTLAVAVIGEAFLAYRRLD